MRKEKSLALKLRLSGKSYGEITKSLGIPKSTLSGWFSGLILSRGVQEEISRKGRKKSTEALVNHNKRQTYLAIKRASTIRAETAKKINNFSQKDLLILGIMLYWAEGYKRPMVRNGREVTYHVVSLTNSDPFLIKIFLKFLREYCCVPNEKIKANLRIFQHHNDKNLIKYWSEQTGIVDSNFGKTYTGVSKSSQGVRPFNRLPYGVIQIVVADTKLFHQIMGYIEGMKKFV